VLYLSRSGEPSLPNGIITKHKGLVFIDFIILSLLDNWFDDY